jgi:cell division protein FtsL
MSNYGGAHRDKAEKVFQLEIFYLKRVFEKFFLFLIVVVVVIVIL